MNFTDAQAVLINPSRASAFGATIVCCLLLLQYAHRRKPFILVWAAAWLLLAPAMLLPAASYGSAAFSNLLLGASQLLKLATSVLFLWSADMLRGTALVQRRQWRAAAGVAAWFLVAPLVLGPRAVLIPGDLLAGAVLAGAASLYAAMVVERRMIGPGLIAFVMLGLAISNLTSAFVTNRFGSDGQLEILVVNSVLYTFGALGMHLLVFEDMTYELRMTNRRLETARQELLQAAITDALTGCHNRRFLEQVTDRELQRHARFKLPLSLIFVDIDRFKAINDTLGHEAGDRVLQYVARFLRRHIREADYVFRYGGDEFLVLITCGGEEAVRKVAALKAAFDMAPEAVDLPPGLGLSVGCIEVPPGTTDLTPLIRTADERMYQDKGRRPETSARPAKRSARGGR